MPFDLQESFVVAAERALGARLPASYREAMMRSNGGERDAEDDTWWLHPIADASDRKRQSRTANHILHETRRSSARAGFPEGALAIAHNGSGDQLILLRSGEVYAPEVYVWWHETGEVRQIAADFTDLDEP